MTPADSSPIAFLGTGLLGSGMATALLQRGVPVTVWNRNPDKAAPLVALGARLAKTPAEAAAGAARVHVCVAEDTAVDAVLAALGPIGRTPIIDHSTCAPAGVKARAARLAESGGRFLHAPVHMSPANARDRAGTVLVSGDASVFEEVREQLEAMASTVVWLGERPELAAAIKLLGNAMGIGLMALLGDVLALSRSLEVPLDTLLAMLDRSNPMAAARPRFLKMAAGELSPSFSLAMANKDVTLMLAAAGDTPVPVLQGVHAQMAACLAQGHADEDYAVIGVVRGGQSS